MLKLNDKGEQVKILQQKLGLDIDGVFGPNTEKKVKEFQSKNGLIADGIVGNSTMEKLGMLTVENISNIPPVGNKSITNQQYIDAAKIIGCEVAAIKAVDTVESSGDGFLSNGDVKILFEPHIFWKELKNVGLRPENYVKGNEDILYQSWKSGAYGPVSNQWNRMNRAIKINKTAALKSASYGRFQVMGFNYKSCGFNDIESFVSSMKINEYEHLKAFIGFIKTNRLDRYLISKNWEAFAKGYNGEAYKKNNYDVKLKDAYNRFK